MYFSVFQPYPGVDIKNFSTSWSDGLAFGALLHRWRPDILDFAHLASMTDPGERLDAVFKVAHDVLGIEKLLDPEGKAATTRRNLSKNEIFLLYRREYGDS